MKSQKDFIPPGSVPREGIMSKGPSFLGERRQFIFFWTRGREERAGKEGKGRSSACP